MYHNESTVRESVLSSRNLPAHLGRRAAALALAAALAVSLLPGASATQATQEPAQGDNGVAAQGEEPAEENKEPTEEEEKPSEEEDKELSELRDKYQDAQDKLDKIKDDIKDTEQNIEDNKANRENQLEAQKQIGTQIGVLTEQVDIITAKIQEKQRQIEEKQREIEQKQREIDHKQAEFDERWAGFKQRMASMQMLNEGGAIALLSSVTNLYELLTFSQAMSDMAERDNEICDELEAQRAELNAAKEDLEDSKAELESVKAEYESNQMLLQGQQNQLGSKWDELDQYIDALDGEIAEGVQTLESQHAEQEALEKAFQEAANALNAYLEAQNAKYSSPTLHCSLDFGIPLQKYTRLTTDFGEGGHLGHDIAAPANTPIYAVADGIVTAAGWHDHPTASYGNYVQILHGKDDQGREFSTLYAHMISTPLVSEGQTVVKGQCIGYVGSTGYSTGNHLHLEMKIDGTRVDPLDYVPLP